MSAVWVPTVDYIYGFVSQRQQEANPPKETAVNIYGHRDIYHTGDLSYRIKNLSAQRL